MVILSISANSDGLGSDLKPKKNTTITENAHQTGQLVSFLPPKQPKKH